MRPPLGRAAAASASMMLVACGASRTGAPAGNEQPLALQLELPGEQVLDVLERVPGSSSTRWSYDFADGIVRSVELARSVADADEQVYSRCAAEAELVADVLEQRFGPGELRRDARWTDVESASDGTRIRLATRSWTVTGARVTWKLEGVAGHHDFIQLLVQIDPGS